MKYAGQCSYFREYKNCWTMNIQFTKRLKAHFKVCFVLLYTVTNVTYYL